MLDDMGLDDFAVYMFSPSMRQAILAEFYKVVEPLLEEQKPFDLVTHSWGTVIAYEGLRALEQHGFDTPPIGCWFTVGAALSIAPVRWSLLAPNKDGRKPKLVRRWINIDAQGDGVGGSLHPHYAVDDEFLEQVPTGCTEGFFGYDLRCAHGSYFRNENIVVNRDRFAKFLVGTGS